MGHDSGDVRQGPGDEPSWIGQHCAGQSPLHNVVGPRNNASGECMPTRPIPSRHGREAKYGEDDWLRVEHIVFNAYREGVVATFCAIA